MRQIAATRRRDRLLQQIASCDMWKSLLPRQNFVAAICRTNSNWFEFVRQIASTKWAQAAFRSSSANEATCRRDASQRFVTPCVSAFREFYQTTTATATKASTNKRVNEQNNGFARAFWILVHFFAVLCKTATWNDQVVRILEPDVNHNG